MHNKLKETIINILKEHGDKPQALVADLVLAEIKSIRVDEIHIDFLVELIDTYVSNDKLASSQKTTLNWIKDVGVNVGKFYKGVTDDNIELLQLVIGALYFRDSSKYERTLYSVANKLFSTGTSVVLNQENLDKMYEMLGYFEPFKHDDK